MDDDLYDHFDKNFWSIIPQLWFFWDHFLDFRTNNKWFLHIEAKNYDDKLTFPYEQED